MQTLAIRGEQVQGIFDALCQKYAEVVPNIREFVEHGYQARILHERYRRILNISPVIHDGMEYYPVAKVRNILGAH